jgi:hypothetical protein
MASETVRKVTRELPCKLSDPERLSLGDKLVQMQTEVDEMQERDLSDPREWISPKPPLKAARTWVISTS